MSTFQALRVHQGPNGRFSRLDTLGLEELTPGEVIVRVAYSSLNYKDALAVTGKGSILRALPRTAGIDLAGVVESSSDPDFRPGDRVLATGAGLGESLDGGLAERARLPGAALVPLPEALSLLEAMALGTAGFTAALALERMLENHQTPAMGPVAVTGPTGGVGGIALMLLKRTGFQATAITGKPDAAARLRELGADAVLERSRLESSGKPLEKALWGGAIDSLGGRTLAHLTRTVRPWGNIACIGLAESAELDMTVLPLILRGVSLLGIHSVEVPRAWRLAIWRKLAAEWRLPGLERLMVRSVIGLEEVPGACEELIAGGARGRYVVRIGGEPRETDSRRGGGAAYAPGETIETPEGIPRKLRTRSSQGDEEAPMVKDIRSGSQAPHAPQVGAADPERRNSPTPTDPEQSYELLREQVGDEAAGCYFNDVLYPDGAHVMSGSTRLRCERGIWVELGEKSG